MKVTLLWKMAGRLVHLGRLLKNGIKTKMFGVGDFGKEDLKYKRWVKETALTAADIEVMKKEIESFAFKPKISLIMPVYNIPRQWLVRAIESVFEQVYENWELCIADDASSKPHIRKVLSRYQTNDMRVKVKFLEENQGISGASNQALSLSAGQYAAFLDHDDELSKDSLFEVVKLLNQYPEAEIIYTDEDKLTLSSQRLRPVYKSDWDPELFLTYNYLCHLVVCRMELVDKVGGFRKGFEGSQDYDLLLRLTELTEKIFHIPKILYHWRMVPGSAAVRVDAKSKSFERAKRALRDAMERRGIRAAVSDGETIGTFCVKEESK
ncbi:MAG: glycosyltransferase [Candidatus Aminicenantes bacterium]|nr:glycosyltransferase [Candidatus Aminicenantes bacterium]NIM83391.1 glycosyltransferase [Candidatus Aminicenantes bacterium]NIN22783.1 glycosyltransferase [Candidatus Aminicenantes bacterium]NIN46517.1 glycosyltransferase [Candidatus Aminicenantes bacterium]NIN89422.1 glycosyltransferase [Candidatus Aminicenantes bacterium]